MVKMAKQIPPILLELEEHIKPFVSTVKARFSRRNVPHLVVSTKDNTFSIYFFKNTRTWRIFYPYPSHDKPQVKFDVPSFGQVVEYFQLGTPKMVGE